MRRGSKGAFSLLFAIAAVVGLGGCMATTGARALLHAKPVTDPDFKVDVYKPDKACRGTTLLADNHLRDRSRIIEVDMRGRIVWEYDLPEYLKEYTNPGFDVEWLPKNNHVLFVLPHRGVYEIDRAGHIVWSYVSDKVSHDVERLPNGDTLVVYGGGDEKDDAQVKEISPQGKIVWAWYAKDYFDKPPYSYIEDEGWTHTNAASRLANGDTLISMRNFNTVVEVNRKGAIVKTFGKGIFHGQHDPEMLPNGDILVANHNLPHRAIELDPATNKIVWQSRGFPREAAPVRDADRLPNGDTLITGSTVIVEISPAGELVWRLRLRGTASWSTMDRITLGFYKAERIPPH